MRFIIGLPQFENVPLQEGMCHRLVIFWGIPRKEGKTYAINDQAGNGYLVDKDGTITKTTATDTYPGKPCGQADEVAVTAPGNADITKANFKTALDAQDRKPLFRNYEDLQEILKEAFNIQEF